MGLRAIVKYPQIDIPRTEREIHRVMTDGIVDAAKTWVINTTDHVPVLSGAAKTTFLKLAAQAGASLAITPRKPDPEKVAMALGGSTGEIIVDYGRTYAFVWSSDLPYIHIVDANNNFLLEGERSLRDAAPALPAPIVSRSRT
jgi:hypothetical protein